MRRIGPLVLILICALLGVVASTYFRRVRLQDKAAPRVPQMLPPNTASTAQDWVYRQSNGNGTQVEVHAKDYRLLDQQDKLELIGLELHLFNKDHTAYNKVLAAKAEFDNKTGILFSDGDVSITLNLPVSGEPKDRPTVVESSGMYFESKTGKVYTDRAAKFQFALGDGTAVGAMYDPQAHELTMKSQAQLLWRGRDPKSVPMKIEAGSVVYKEGESKVYLSPWSKLTRDTLTMDGGSAVASIQDGRLTLVEAQNAKGVDNQPERKLEYSAGKLTINFDDDGVVNHMHGEGNAQLTSSAKSGITHVSTDRVDLVYGVDGKVSTLQAATANGHSVVESTPAAPPGGVPAEKRVLKSDSLTAHMLPGGQEIDSIETTGPGSIEFIPAVATQSHRVLTGDRMFIRYGATNQIQSFESTNVSTRTDRPRQPGMKQAPAPALTWSRELKAEFDPKTAQLTRLDQTKDFRYEEGDRRARADRALLDQAKNIITLTGSARVWDATGTTTGNTIVLNQATGDFTADGNVNSTRMPDQNADNGMLSHDEPLHARAKRMSIGDSNMKVHYEGDVVLWQGANRLQADVVDIDRDAGILKAHGKVISQLVDKKDETAAHSAAKGAIFTIVHAPDLVYTDDTHLALYSGGAKLERPDLSVKAHEIRAFLREQQDDKSKPAAGPPVRKAAVTTAALDGTTKKKAENSSLDHAVADGNVEIVSSQAGRTRVGTSEHAEYFTDDGRAVLTEGKPKLVDSLKGTTTGRQLTWYSQDGRLLVNGVATQPASSLVLKKTASK